MKSVYFYLVLIQAFVVLLTSAFIVKDIRRIKSAGSAVSSEQDTELNAERKSNSPYGTVKRPKRSITLKAVPNMAHMKGLETIMKENSTEGNMFEAINFMQKFGYIPAGDNNADFIFTAESLTEKLKLVQKFGAIPETGVLDEATVKLMASPRCGNKDVEPEVGKRRRKRYIIGSPGWNKRNLTYTVANWSPKLMSKENMQVELKRAFDHWSQYSYLKFTEIESNAADIIIFFASYDHYDLYPFDGPGGLLAHAYYPYDFENYGGDIHFDESEDWKFRPEDDYSGLDFFTVAVHEIGHSLGLAHSTVQSSIMFPYYKGMEKNFVMAYDDIMAMWDLYIRRKLEGDDEYFNTEVKTTTTTTQPTTTTPPTTPPTTPLYEWTQNDEGEDNIRYYGDSETVDEHEKRKNPEKELPPLPPFIPEDDYIEIERKRREEEERIRREEEERRRREEEERLRREEEERIRKEEEERIRREEDKRREEEEEEDRKKRWEDWGKKSTTFVPSPDDHIDDMCAGNFDSVALLRNELFIFKGKNMWRYKNKGDLRYGYPAPIRNMFENLPNWIKKIDAAYERRNDSRIVLFAGKYFYVYDGTTPVEDSPRPLTEYGLPEAITALDAAFFWPKNNKTYLFSRNLYWRRNDMSNKMDENYPRGMERWHGIPKNLDAVLTDKEGTSYFFKGNQIWQYDNTNIRPTIHSPVKDLSRWTGC